MPTLNKLEYLDETKQQIKSALNTNFNSQITDDDTFRSYVSKIDNIYTNWPKVTDEGTSVNLSNTKKGKMTISPKGNTEQDGEPTPDVPVDVKVVTGNNTIKVTGKNLCKSYTNGTNTNRYYDSIYIEADFKIGKKYALSFIDKSVGNSYYRNEHFMQNIPSYSITATGERQTYYFECKSNDKTSSRVYVEGKGFIILKNDNSLSNLPQFEDVQIEEVESYDIPSTPYIPYQSQEYSLNLGSIELCKIGTYQDYIYKENNKWYKYSEIGKVVLDGNITGSIRSDIQNQNTVCFRTDAGVTNILTGSVPISDHFTALNNTSDVEHIRYIGINEYRFQIFLSKTKATTSNEVIAWLNTHNTTVYYVLDTPTNTEITDTDLIEDLEALLNTKSYDTQTNISSTYTSGNAQMIISVAALKKGGN